MPINKKLMNRLQWRYGKDRGRIIYYVMEQNVHPATKVAIVKEHNRDGTHINRHKRKLRQ